METISSAVALIHWPNVGRVFQAGVPLWVVAAAWLRLEKMPEVFSRVPVAVVVLGSAAAVRLLKKPMFSFVGVSESWESWAGVSENQPVGWDSSEDRGKGGVK